MVDAEQFAELVSQLQAVGYQEHPSETMVAEIDGIMATVACETCGHRGLTYRPFTLRSGYHAFAVCPDCGSADEF